MKNLIDTLGNAKATTEGLRSLNDILSRILEIEQDGDDNVVSVILGTQGDRVECGGGDVAIADSQGRRVTLEELIFAVEYVEFLRSRGITVDNLPKSILGLTTDATKRVKDFAALSGNDQLYSTDGTGAIALIPKSSYLGALSGNNLVYRTGATGITGGEARSNYQNQSSRLDALTALTLAANQLIGTDGSGNLAAIAQSAPRLAGSFTEVAFDVSGNPYVDSGGWYWHVPDGTAISSSNSRYLNLYTALWGTTSYVVSGGRGASAAADWAAGKTLTIPDMRGRVNVMSGQGSGLTNRTIAGIWGTETASLSTSNMPLHNHAIAVNTINATGLVGAQVTGYGVISLGSVVPNQQNIQGNRVAANDGLGAIRDNGSGTAFNISQPSIAITRLLWMNTK